MSHTVCQPCAPYKVMETTFPTKILSDHNSTSKNLDRKSYNFIWEYFTERLSSNLPPGNIHSRIHQSNWPQLYDRLSKFANLPFISKKTSLYQLYLITKPTDLTDPDYRNLKSLSIATLITILWAKLKEYILDRRLPFTPGRSSRVNLPRRDASPSVQGGSMGIDLPTEEIFISAVKDQSLDQIENDVELLIDHSPTRLDWIKILNLYIFYQDGAKLENSQLINRNPLRDDKNHLYRQVISMTYYWPKLLDDSCLRTDRTILSTDMPRFKTKIQNPISFKNSIPDIFNTILTGNHLFPTFRLNNFSQKYKKLVNRWILAEAVLRRFVWRHLRIMFMPDHNLLVQTLKLKQLSNIYQGKSLCDVITIPDNSPAWITYITNIGNILISRAANELSGCDDDKKLSIQDFPKDISWFQSKKSISEDMMEDEDVKNLGYPSLTQARVDYDKRFSSETYQTEDLEKEFLRKWYDQDRDYALVALANSIRLDGSVDICSLNIQIKARIKRGVLSRKN